MKITVELPDWAEVVTFSIVGAPFPQLRVQVTAATVKDGCKVAIPDKAKEG